MILVFNIIESIVVCHYVEIVSNVLLLMSTSTVINNIIKIIFLNEKGVFI